MVERKNLVSSLAAARRGIASQGALALAAMLAMACSSSQPHDDGAGPPVADASVYDANVQGDDGGALDATRGGGDEGGGEDAGATSSDGGGASPAVRFIGRMDTTKPAQPSFEWEGCAIEANFTGTSVSVTLAGDASLTNYFAVFVDGVEQPRLVVNGSAATSYPIATGLGAGTHHVLVFRRDESFQNPTRFVSFDFGPGGQLLAPPPAPTRRIEVIGDSISAGYGVECTNAKTPFSPDTENEYLAYGSVAARDLDADAHILAWAGEGVYRNYDSEGGAGTLMPDYWLRTLPTLPTSAWDFTQWIPDAVVVNLGTNDFSTTPPADINTEFQSHYLALIQSIHAKYPKAWVFCALGPMLSDPQLTEVRTGINAVIGTMKGSGFQDITLVEFPVQDCGASGELCGCDYHPSQATQKSMATSLEAAIRAALGW